MKTPNVVKINRQISWFLVLASVFNYSTGYVLTILNIPDQFFLLGHQILGVFFLFLTVFHFFITVVFLRYPWRDAIRRTLSRESEPLLILKLAQRVTGWIIIIPASLILLSGADWFKIGTGYLLPFTSHIRFDAILGLTIIVHAGIGLKFALMRRRKRKDLAKMEFSPARREAIAVMGSMVLSVLALAYIDRIPRIGALKDKISNILPPGQYEVKALRPLYVGLVPQFNEEDWDFEAYGLVENPVKLTYGDLKKLSRTVSVSDFHCVTGWTRFDNKWEGVRLRTLIKIVGLKSNAKYATIECENNYTTSLPLEDLEYDDVLLAYRLDNKDLPPRNGGPLRLVVPHKYGYKSAKWVRKIKFTEEQELGYWEQRGYSNTADPFTNDRYSPWT